MDFIVGCDRPAACSIASTQSHMQMSPTALVLMLILHLPPSPHMCEPSWPSLCKNDRGSLRNASRDRVAILVLLYFS